MYNRGLGEKEIRWTFFSCEYVADVCRFINRHGCVTLIGIDNTSTFQGSKEQAWVWFICSSIESVMAPSYLYRGPPHLEIALLPRLPSRHTCGHCRGWIMG